MKKLLLLLLIAVGTANASTVYTCGLITAFGTQPNGVLTFYPVAGTYGTNIETTLSTSVNFTNGCFTNLTLTGGNYEVDYYNRMLLNIFVIFGDTNNWQLTDLATNLTSYVTVGQLGVFSNNVYAAALAAGTTAAQTVEQTLSNVLSTQITNATTNFFIIATNIVNNTLYTNGNKRAFLGIIEQLSSANGNTPSAVLFVGNTTYNWITTNSANLQLTGGAAGQTGANMELSTIIGPGQVFTLSNFTAGGTSSVVTSNTAVWFNF